MSFLIRTWFLLRLDQLDLGDDDVHAAGQIIAPGALHIVVAVDAEGNEQESRLVVVDLGLVDDGDLPLVAVQFVLEFVGDDGAGCAGAEDDDAFHGLADFGPVL